MGVYAEQYREGLELLTNGAYNIAAASLALALLGPASTTPPAVDATGLTYNSTLVTPLHVIPITSQAWSWDANTRTRVLVPTGSIGFTAGGTPETVNFAVLFDAANTHPPFTLFTWPSGIVFPASTAQVFDIPELVRFRAFSDLSPTPVANVYQPVILQDTNGINYRVTGFAAALGTLVTTEVDARASWLQAPDTTYHQLVVSTAGVVTAAGTGTPASGDRVFTTARPCRIPDTTASAQRILTVGNTGTLTVT